MAALSIPKRHKPLCRKALLVEHGAVASLLPWVVAVMFLLCGLLLLSGMMAMRLAGHWQDNLEGSLTIQAKNQPEQLNELIKLVNKHDAIAKVKLVKNEEAAALLEPWLGKVVKGSGALTLPAMIDVQLKPERTLDLATLQQQLRGIDPSVTVEGFGSWLAKVSVLTGTIRLITIVIGVLVFGGLMIAIAATTRIHFALNRRIVGILHMIGASDEYISKQFERSARRLMCKSIVLAVALAGGLLLLAYLLWPSSIQEMPLWKFRPKSGEALALCILFFITPLVASIISRRSALKALEGFSEA